MVFKTAIGTLAVAFWVNEELISLLGVAEPCFGHIVIKGLTGLIRVPWPRSLYLLALLCSICLRGFACICMRVVYVCLGTYFLRQIQAGDSFSVRVDYCK